MAFDIEQPGDLDSESAVVEPTKPRLLGVLGPGLITGVSDDDPSGIATYSQAGAQFGYADVDNALYLSADDGGADRKRPRGAHYRARHRRRPAAALSTLAAYSNGHNAADCQCHQYRSGPRRNGRRFKTGARRPADSLCPAVRGHLHRTSDFLQYTRYVSVLKWLTLFLFAYVATLFMVKVPWTEALKSLFVPSLHWDKDYLTTVVAVLGTTISPYLFFWQASQEAEDVRTAPARQILKRAPHQGEGALNRIHLDTFVGMGFSNFIALAIMITVAATLHANDVTDIQTSAQAAQALRPIAGSLAETIFALGVIGTGLLSVPVLAGSAAYAVGEARGWPTGLARQPMEAKAFYAVICIATIVGMIMNFTPIDPIRALYWSAVINGVVAVPSWRS